MNKDKKKLYTVSLLIFAALLCSFFIGVEIGRMVVAFLMIPLTVAVCFCIRKRRSVSIQKKEVLLVSTVMAVLFVIAIEMTGLYFKFYKNPYFVSLEILLERVVPIAVIIVTTEIIRNIMLAQQSKAVTVITYFSCVISEALMYSNVAGITSYNRFMDLIGLTLFPAISANVYYHYISKRYGMMPNIVFRLVTTLYAYFIPATTGMSDALTACFKIIFPIIMLAFVAAMFEKKKRNAARKNKKLGAIGTVLTVGIVVSVAMIISCQFRFGALVIATDSMTGEINRGDMILYERYDGQRIEEGQVVVFLQNEAKIVHRVVGIENIGGELRYYTKGDANDTLDSGYRVADDIVGLSDVKLSFIGYPTLWLREIIKD